VPASIDPDLKGFAKPRLELYSDNEPYSRMEEFRKIAKHYCNVDLMEWQLHCLSMLVASRNGKLAHQRSLITVGRQNGKSVMLKVLAIWWLLYRAHSQGPQQVLVVAHRYDMAVRLFRTIAWDLGSETYKKASFGKGTERIEMHDGSELTVASATDRTGHGLSLDLAIIDELWSVKRSVVDDGISPATIARPDPLVAAFSTAGTEDSELMIDWRDEALGCIDSGDRDHNFYFAEWSPPPNMDDSQPEAWQWSNPAMGTTITSTRLAAEARKPDHFAFIRAHCNSFVTSLTGWLPHGTWELVQSPGLVVPPGGNVAVEETLDCSHFGAVRTIQVGHKYQVESAYFDDEISLFEQLAYWYQDGAKIHLPQGLAIRRPPDIRIGQLGELNYTFANRVTGPVRQLVQTRHLEVSPSHQLTEQVLRATPASTEHGMSLSQRKSSGPIPLARALVFSVGLCLQTKRTPKVA
jgi:hypothetical protein